MGKVAKIKFKVRKLFAKIKIRRRLKKDAATAAHQERLAQVQRVDGTEHKIERSVDVMVAARRSVYGAHMLPQTTEFGVTVEEAQELNKKQKANNIGKKAVGHDAATQDGGIWDGSAPKDDGAPDDGAPDNRI